MRYITTENLTSGMRVSFPRRPGTFRVVDHIWTNTNDEPVLTFTDGYKMVTTWAEAHIVVD